ncbi:hypothetical protein HY620_00335 [Candidatus Uhrbacteria bacterium]|nr:hypothetical protein [Candidatus Uhrbacteria bacterium]
MEYRSSLSLLFISAAALLSTSILVSAEQKGAQAIFEPGTVKPGGNFAARLTGFAPSSQITIAYDGQTDGAAAHLIASYLQDPSKMTDAFGSVVYEGRASEYDVGDAVFTFTDAQGNSAQATLTVKGVSPRRILYAPHIEVNEQNILIALTGIGWFGDKRKSVIAYTPDSEQYVPEFVDLCGGEPCQERADGLKLLVTLPRSTHAGEHTFIVDQQNGESKTTHITIPELPENQEYKQYKASIYLVDPPMATVNIPSIAVRGSDWGPYEKRRNVRAWFVDQENKSLHELKVDRNYRECAVGLYQGIAGGCHTTMEKDDLFLRLEIPDGVKHQLTSKNYLLYIRTENRIEAAAQFRILAKPSFESLEKPAIIAVPDHGPTGTTVALFGEGFARGEGLNLRFDSVRLPLGVYFSPERDGTFENILFSIPQTLQKKEGAKEIVVAIDPGTHIITVSNDNPRTPLKAQTIFIVEKNSEQKKDDPDQKKKEQAEKERLEKEQAALKKEQEKIKKEEERLEKERKELEKKLKKKLEEEKNKKNETEKKRVEDERKNIEEQLKRKKELEEKKEDRIEQIIDRREEIAKRFCDESLPITFQPGCIQKKSPPKKNLYDGQLCSADKPITFQPGCIAQRPLEQVKPFLGRPCSSDLPLIWQEGCVPEIKNPVNSEFEGKPCRADMAITFQPGCVSKPRTNIIEPSAQNQGSSSGKPCNPLIPTFSQPGCKE